MFAFALWDRTRRRLLLARDRVWREAPLLPGLPEGGIVFASELKALREHPGVSDRLDQRALGHYLELNYTLTAHCILSGVQKLPPAHLLTIETGRPLRTTRYWDLARCFGEKARFGGEDEAAEALASLLDDSVRLRMVSDVPLGAFLSGGLDSSTVVASMCRARAAEQNHTFSAGFREPTYSELPEAALVARQLGVEHHELLVESDVVDRLSAVIDHGDEPFGDSSALPVFALSEFARRRVTVCLAGDGADEILAGYETYVADRLHRVTQVLPTAIARSLSRGISAALPVTWNKVGWDDKLRRFLAAQGLSTPAAHAAWRQIFLPDQRRRLVRPELARDVLAADAFEDTRHLLDDVRGAHYVDQAMYYDVKTWLADDILVKVDRNSMAHASRCVRRSDHRVVEFAARLPVKWKLRGLTRKYILQQSQRGRVPDSVAFAQEARLQRPREPLVGLISEARVARCARDGPARGVARSRGARSSLEGAHRRPGRSRVATVRSGGAGALARSRALGSPRRSRRRE